MEKSYPGIEVFGYIYRAFFFSESEAGLLSAWHTIIYCVPVGHPELPLLHQAAKERQVELRSIAAKEKAKEKAEKDKPLIVNDTTREENERWFSSRYLRK